MATIKKKIRKAQTDDTTRISKPYKVTADEFNSLNPNRDSISAKMRSNAKMNREMIKRNFERQKEGKSPISYKSLTGSDVAPFSKKGKSFKEAPIKEAPKKKSGGTVAKDGKWIQKAIKKPGALRKQLGAKPGQPIPAGKLAAAAKKPGKLGQRARLAQTLKKMKKK